MKRIDRQVIGRHSVPEIVLQERVQELDAGREDRWHRRRRSEDPREQFACVMSRWTDALAEERVDPDAVITPAVADSIVADSALLKEIAASDSDLVYGPLDRRRQQWTPIGAAASTGEAPSRGRFIEPGANLSVGVKPWQFGLYTSTGAVKGPSMWRLLLGLEESWKGPLGRYAWALDVDQNARIAEISTAVDWVEFVCAHPYVDGRRVLPNWAEVAARFDAVHFTASVIAAVQAFPIRVGDAIIPAAYWDVEATFWLNWSFSGVRLLERPEA